MSAALGRCALSALLPLALGCGQGVPGEAEGPRLETRWTGSDTAEFAAAAVAERCDSLNLLEIRAVAGDTGVALAVYRKDTILAGDYPIRHPDVADTTPPSAAVALRWLEQTAIRGFRSDSGTLTLSRAENGALSGSFTAAVRDVSDTGRLAVTGSFEHLRVRPATRGCAPRAAPPDTGPGVD